MAHARETIRTLIKTRLTSLSTTGANVYSMRVYPVETLPCLSIYINNESVESITLNGDQYRVIDLTVEGRAKATSELDNTLDDIAAEVETALFTDETLSGNVKSIEYVATEIELNDELEQPAGIIRLSFNVFYRVNKTTPTTIIS